MYSNIIQVFTLFMKAIFPGQTPVPPRSGTWILDLSHDPIWAIWLAEVRKFHQHHDRICYNSASYKSCEKQIPTNTNLRRVSLIFVFVIVACERFDSDVIYYRLFNGRGYACSKCMLSGWGLGLDGENRFQFAIHLMVHGTIVWRVLNVMYCYINEVSAIYVQVFAILQKHSPIHYTGHLFCDSVALWAQHLLLVYTTYHFSPEPSWFFHLVYLNKWCAEVHLL